MGSWAQRARANARQAQHYADLEAARREQELAMVREEEARLGTPTQMLEDAMGRAREKEEFATNTIGGIMRGDELERADDRRRLIGLADANPYDQQKILDEAMSGPLYDAIMSGRNEGENAILRSAAATGGLRSGNTNYELADFNAQLKRQAVLDSYQARLGEITQGRQEQIGLGQVLFGESSGRAGDSRDAWTGQLIDRAESEYAMGQDMANARLGIQIQRDQLAAQRRLARDQRRASSRNRWTGALVGGLTGFVTGGWGGAAVGAAQGWNAGGRV